MQSNKKMDFADEMSMYRDNFISYNHIADKSINTINTYKNCLDSFVEFCYENNDQLSFKTLQQKDITNYFIYLDNLYKKKHHNVTQNNKKSISTSTKAHYITILKIFFKYITNNNYNFIDLEKILSTYKIAKKKQHKFENFMTKEEREKILLFLAQALNKNKNFKNMRNSLLIKLMLQSGLRISEALSLKFSDFSKSDDGEFYDITILAKGGEYQTAFIASELIDRELHFLFSSKVGDYIFTNGFSDTPITRQNVYGLLARVYRKCGIVGKRGCHILRHSFAMNFVEKNTNLGIVQKALRHKKIQTTMIYADPTSEMVKKEMKRIASA